MDRKTKKSHVRRRLEEALIEVGLRSIVILLLGLVTFLLAARPPWAVNAVRLLIDAAKGAAAYL